MIAIAPALLIALMTNPRTMPAIAARRDGSSKAAAIIEPADPLAQDDAGILRQGDYTIGQGDQLSDQRTLAALSWINMRRTSHPGRSTCLQPVDNRTLFPRNCIATRSSCSRRRESFKVAVVRYQDLSHATKRIDSLPVSTPMNSGRYAPGQHEPANLLGDRIVVLAIRLRFPTASGAAHTAERFSASGKHISSLPADADR